MGRVYDGINGLLVLFAEAEHGERPFGEFVDVADAVQKIVRRVMRGVQRQIPPALPVLRKRKRNRFVMCIE